MKSIVNGNQVAINNKLYRPDNNRIEKPVDGVEYFSPDQQGGRYGAVHRVYFETTLPPFLTAGNKVARLMDCMLSYGQGANRNVIRGVTQNGTGVVLQGLTGKNNLLLQGISGGVINGWVDYTKHF